jgi:uncharacterized protein (TIGR00299 family) protein
LHIHLDLTGGIAGDMFSAALLDAMPELELPLLSMLKGLQLESEVQVSVSPASDKGLSGKRFNVELRESDHRHESADHHHHHWSEIRQFIFSSELEADVKTNVLGIFSLLAAAEAKVHNMDIETVQFHEVGAWDCIVDIISAGWLICHSKVKSWSISDLPWGGGTVKCAHGNIPVPAPATINLLQGFTFSDDGIKGERITPTGAAILAWITPSRNIVSGILKTSGYGMGTRKLADRANVLRASLIAPEPVTETETETEKIAIIQCDIDDMSGEMLAIAREKIRNQVGVLEITESMSHGKKNRFISTLTILCQPSQIQTITDAILNNTSTLGIRYWHCNRISLQRVHHQVTHNDQQFNVKSVRRPDNSITSKLEADHVAAENNNYQGSNQLKRDIEQQAEEEYHEHQQ